MINYSLISSEEPNLTKLVLTLWFLFLLFVESCLKYDKIYDFSVKSVLIQLPSHTGKLIVTYLSEPEPSVQKPLWSLRVQWNSFHMTLNLTWGPWASRQNWRRELSPCIKNTQFASKFVYYHLNHTPDYLMYSNKVKLVAG